jgi:hypothetical protein
MRKIKIQIIGPVGSGKSIIANLLRFQLGGNVAELEFSDDEPPLDNWVPSARIGDGALANTAVEIQTIQTRGSPE